MTRIDQLTPGQLSQADKIGKTAGPGQGPSFQDFLEKAVDLEAADPTAGASAPAAPVAAQPVTAVGRADEAQAAALTQAEKALALLDEYQAGLGDPATSLKALDGVVRSMEDQSRELSLAMGGLEPDDRLRGLLSEVAATTEAETIKFRRGDYLP